MADQVAHCHHSKDFKAIETKDIIFGYSPGKRRFENPGADDKNGIFICLECLKKYDTIKIAFFREEETGCAAVPTQTCLFSTTYGLSSSPTGKAIPT